ncbi:MAG: putative toxin-antitoxin system toxin component, PIN family [Bryobacterales bacterium]|nr:putative toxin-antitoxin system toxin component, PIN family [Bryobacterales bacterium]
MRIFLDTNVLVAAFATRGLCADVLRTVLAEHQLITGEVVLDELRDVLTRRFQLSPGAVADIVALLRAQEVIAKPSVPSDIPVRDPDDRWILASAVAGRADVLVTGDQDLLAIADQAPLAILSPRSLWDRLRSRA